MKNKLLTFSVLLAVFVISFAVYLYGAAPTLLYGDSAEFQAVANLGGVAHPSGYPTFILLGQLFRQLVTGDLAHRITVMSAFFGAAGLLFLALVFLRLGFARWLTLTGCLIFGTTFTFWWSSLRAEVYSMGTCFFLLALWLTLRAIDTQSLKRISLAGLAMGLTLTCHLAFAPALAIMAGFLAWKHNERQRSRTPIVATIAVAFLLGLSPYIYTMWADTVNFPMNYLHYSVALEANQFGLTAETFDDPWERLPWLIFGREYLPASLSSHPSIVIGRIVNPVATEVLFEFGPLAFLAILMGAVYLIRKRTARSALFLAMPLLSLALAIPLENERMLHIFLVPATVCMAILIPYGIRYTLSFLKTRRGPQRKARISMGILLLAAAIVLPHLLRVHAYDHPIGPFKWRMQESCTPQLDSLIPSLRGFTEARQYGEEILNIVPQGALIIGYWEEIMPLYYLRYVENVRTDIELDPFYPEHLSRLQSWQDSHDVRQQPFIFLDRIPQVWSHVVDMDSLRLASGRMLYGHRGRLSFE